MIMKSFRNFIISITGSIIILFALFAASSFVNAQLIEPHPACPGGACWPTTQINQHACNDCTRVYVCQGATSQTCRDDDDCGVYGGGSCIRVCGGTFPRPYCSVWNSYVVCNQGGSTCRYEGRRMTCQVNVVNETCNEDWEDYTQGCCGPGSGTPTPTGGPTPTSPPGGCNNHGFFGASVNPDPASANGAITVSCDYGAVIDCIQPTGAYSGCAWTGWNGTSAQFNCTAPGTSGSYNHICSLVTGTADDCCARQDSIPYSVAGGVPSCTSFQDIKVGTCDLNEWNGSPRDAQCYSGNNTVALFLNNTSATQMRFLNTASATVCSTLTGGEAGWSGWVGYTSPYNWTLSGGDGDRKVCVQFRNASGDSAFCGALTTVDTASPTCSVSGPTSVCVGGSGTYAVDGADTNLRIAEVWRSPTSLQTWTNIFSSPGGCTGNGCDGSGATTFNTAGSYYLTCNAYDPLQGAVNGHACSGNPWCEWSPNPPNTQTCGPSWSDCTANDLLTVDVIDGSTFPAPGNLTPSGLICDAVNVAVDWNDVTGASSYRLNVDRGYSSWNNCSALNPGDNCYYPAASNQTVPVQSCYNYGVRVRAESACGNGPFSSWQTFNTSNSPVNPPTGLNPSGLICDAGGSVTLSWNAGANCNELYALRVDNTTANGWNGQCNNPLPPNPDDTCINNVGGTSFNLPVTAGNSYNWWVHYRNACAWSPLAGTTMTVMDTPSVAPTNLVTTMLNPPDNCDYGPSPNNVTFTWNNVPGSVAGVTSYQVQVDQWPIDATFSCAGPFDPGDHCLTKLADAGLTSSIQDTLDVDLDYTWRVAVTNACGTGPASAGVSFFYDQCSIDGQVRQDDYGDATLIGGRCSEAPSPPYPGVQPGPNSIVNLNPGGYFDDTIDPGNGQYSIDAPAGGPYTLSLSVDPDPALGWACTCPFDGSNPPSFCGSYSVTNPEADVNFFVSDIQASWWQVVDGDVHADANVGVTIPGTCMPLTCTPWLMLSTTGSDGVLTHGAGGDIGVVSSSDWEATSLYAGDQFLFNFWRDEAESLTPLPDLVDQPPVPASPNNVWEIQVPAGNITLSGSWANIDEVKTIFVNFTDGDPSDNILYLNPSGGEITMVGNGLLVLLTNGSMRVEEPVTLLEGVYMTDQVFRTCGDIDDCGFDVTVDPPVTTQLRVNGTVVAWGNVDLQRDLWVRNNDTPGEVFTYVPEFITRLPAFFRRSLYTWREVAP